MYLFNSILLNTVLQYISSVCVVGSKYELTITDLELTFRKKQHIVKYHFKLKILIIGLR